MRKFSLRDISNPLEIVMARIAKVGGSKTKEHSYRATVSTFIFQEICTMFRTHLKKKYHIKYLIEYLLDKLKKTQLPSCIIQCKK